MEYLFQEKTITLPLGTEALIREASLGAERLLFSKKAQIHRALPSYWAHCTLRLGDIEKPTRSDILNLRTPDQVFLAIEIFRLSFGDTIVLRGDLPGSGKPAAYEVNLAELDVIPLPEGASGPDPVFNAVLPKTRHVIEFGYLNGHQMLDEVERDDISPARLELARIRSIDGSPAVRMRDIEQWPMADHKALREAFESTKCGYDTRIRFRDDDGREAVMNLLTDPSFLFPAQVARD
jgi:hypothetical protein